MNDSEIISCLGGVTSVARMLGIKPPSVSGWMETGIPEGRLIELAAQIEKVSGGKFSRVGRWPDRYAFYWPELAHAPANSQQTAATQAA
jgi:DNA-binding transcriptional regulator YdaS (Cro superfamily)